MDDEIKLLKKELEFLKGEVERLAKMQERHLSTLGRYNALQDRHLDILDREVGEALERVGHVELAIFPNLQKDINRLHSIIGEVEPLRDGPLDRRDR